jgi:hypothetical protein
MKFIQWTIVGASLALCMGCTTAQINSTANTIEKVLAENSQVSTEEVGRGLKEALTQGVSKGSSQASQVDGYFKNSLLKILMPPEMQKVNTKLRSLGFNKLMDDFELSLNRGAEEAAKEAKPIFVNAITSMTIQDAWNILKGEHDAATVYLKRTTNSELYTSFKPVIQNSLQKVNATKYYTDIITTYNKIPLVEKVNPDLNDYVTNKAIDGLFILVKEEEANIRNNPSARATELLKKVFTQENMKK